MAATSGYESNSEAWMDVVHTGDLLWWGFRAAPLLVRGLVVIHYKFLNLYEALDDWYHPEVHVWDLQHTKSNTFQILCLLD